MLLCVAPCGIALICFENRINNKNPDLLLLDIVSCIKCLKEINIRFD